MIYPDCVCLLADDAVYYYHEDNGRLAPLPDAAAFKDAAAGVRERSFASKPFMRVLAADSVTCSALQRILAMFEPAGVQAMVKLRADDAGYVLARVAELVGKAAGGEGRK
jgi:hypothetical protein